MVSQLFIFLTLVFSSNAKILRNNALMTKMVSNFRKDIEPIEPQNKVEPVLQRMQNLLCNNFQTVPCEMITQDMKLRKLIEQSIQQINNKKLILEKTTPASFLTLFPIASDEMTRQNEPKHKHKRKKEKRKFKTKDTRTLYNRKKIRKFYPHKVKYKDKNLNGKKDFGDYSEEKLSMSVEVPDMTLTKRHQHLSYKVESADPPVWRIDYMKHEEPSLNMFGFEKRLKDKLMRNNQNVVIDDRDGSSDRKDVIHPDLYIRKNYFSRKDNANLHSDILE